MPDENALHNEDLQTARSMQETTYIVGTRDMATTKFFEWPLIKGPPKKEQEAPDLIRTFSHFYFCTFLARVFREQKGT